MQFLAISDLADALPANKLVSRHCAMQCPDILVVHARCDFHQAHLCATRAISPLRLLNPLYSLHTQSSFAKVHIAFISALIALLAEGRVAVSADVVIQAECAALGGVLRKAWARHYDGAQVRQDTCCRGLH